MIISYKKIRIKNYDPIVDHYYGLTASDFYTPEDIRLFELDAIASAIRRGRKKRGESV